MSSTTADKKRIRLWAIFFWLAVWEMVARLIGQEILLVSPVLVLRRFLELAAGIEFWKAAWFSFFRIAGGFLLALLSGILLAVASTVFPPIKELAKPLMVTIKSIPVASFVILLLIWIPSRNLSVVISFLMVWPIIYTNILQGIENTDKQLLEMAQVFQLSAYRRIRYIYLSEVVPFFRTACSVALGLCWKAGVAAEVIGIPEGSIGEKLYESKIYLETTDLFAWTIAIILLSVCFEKLFLWAADRLLERLTAG